MKILLTGHEGCVGSHLSRFLEGKGYTVTPFQGDIRDRNNWDSYTYVDPQDRSEKWDCLIHLAAIPGVRRSFEEPEFYYDNNVNGTRLALEFGAENCHRHLYASSSNAYEWYGNPYAATKKMCEVMAHDYPNSKGMRFHTVWPGRDDMLYKKLERGEVTYINANHHRDWIHVDDLCNAIWKIMINFPNIIERVLDIGTGESFNVLDMAMKRFNWTGEIRRENPAGERVHTKANVKYLHRLGWQPENNIL